MSEYLTSKKVGRLPRLPLEGTIDLTYRCNNDCRHCWLWLPIDAPEKKKELTFEEIRRIVDEARALGCHEWSISGGEPMLREDFPEIFDYIARNSMGYTLNTNGTLITPRIARLMKRKGKKWIALYGATAEVHDHVTRNPGSFEAFLRGTALLREAGADFVVQIIPMRDNFHQFKEMEKLAGSLSPDWRTGISWLYLSASGDPKKNDEIRAQRLSPAELNGLEKLGFSEEEPCLRRGDDRLFAACIEARRDFHVDPYGGMSFCDKIKDPRLRYDLRKGSVQRCWDEFIPGLPEKIRGESEYLENCGSCTLRRDCSWCAAYAYLEHGKFAAKVDYLCGLAEEKKMTRLAFETENRRYYQLAGLTIRIDSELPITDSTFHPKFKHFEVEGPGEDVVSYSHHFHLPEMDGPSLGKKVHRKAPWAIYRKKDSWIYVWIGTAGRPSRPGLTAVFNDDYTRARIYSESREAYLKGGLMTLTFFPTDQLPLGRVLADRQACFIHSSGLVLNGRGMLFVGHSEAGKSTIVKMLKGRAKVLCDDRIVVRKWPEGFRIHGTWGHGEVPDVSPDSAPLEAIFFLEKAGKNELIRITDRKAALARIWACLIKGFMLDGWWEKILPLIEGLARDIPCYALHFDKSGGVVDLLEGLPQAEKGSEAP
jgi:MoaA/NifB/PqqE/SkfB family radical SAM enzyme